MTIDVPNRLSSTKRRNSRRAIGGSTIAGRLVGQQNLRMAYHRPGDRRPLLLAARQHWRIGIDAIAEPNPIEEFQNIGAIARLRLADDPERQCDVLIGGEMVEQAKVLEDDADPATDSRQLGMAERRRIATEGGDQSARRPNRQKKQTEQTGLPWRLMAR